MTVVIATKVTMATMILIASTVAIAMISLTLLDKLEKV